MRTRTKIVIAALALVAAVLIIAAAVATSWAPDQPVSALAARWAPPPSKFVQIAGMNVHLRDEGPADDPVPIILIHGTSASLHTWEGWASVLRTHHRVVSFDLPGFGLTGPAPSGDYSAAANVRFMRALLDRLDIQHCVLAGNSLGGNIALETAYAFPERVDKLVLVDSGGYPAVSTSVPIGFRVARIPVLNRLMQSMLPRGLIESSLRNVYGDPAKVTPALVDRYFDMTLREGNRSALLQRFGKTDFGSHSSRIASLKLPTLIIWGGRDHLIPPENAEHFHRDIAGSSLVVFGDLGHVPQEEDPARTVAAVESFLDTAGK
ncbi:MAG TPA: alpha/beta hydrolase [Steroidobacteraceae bacterium]|nr:alpha/beta hydrolase [Steroidobacteraceae bacterium]